MVRHHNLRSLLAGALFCALLPAAAFAQNADVTAALTEASKVLQKGGYVKAIELIDTALKSGRIQADLAAKALLMRAQANEKLGRSAFALADYNSAMWMQGLTAGDRKRAEEGQGRVLQGLGVAERPAEPQAAPPANAASRPAPQQAAAPEQPRETAPNTAVKEAPSEERTGGIGSIFDGLFGSSNPEQPAPVAAQQSAPPANTAAVVATPPLTGQPQAARTAQAAPRQPALAQQQAPAVRQSENGRFTIQFAALAEEDKAIAEADRIGRKFGADLGGRSASLMIVPTSDGGTLYKVVAGAFETKGEGQATCEMLKTKGVSCMVITRK